MDDDWLVDEQELTPDNYQQYVSDREWNSLKNEFVKAGYREGVKEGADNARQLGFEAGFAQGGPLLLTTGYQIGLLDTLKIFYARTDSPALDEHQRSELDALVNDLAAQSDQSLLAEADVTRKQRAERIQRLADVLQLGTVPTHEVSRPSLNNNNSTTD
jgi:flagellar biosynthesis/type III secretory pathway protein FliH